MGPQFQSGATSRRVPSNLSKSLVHSTPASTTRQNDVAVTSAPKLAAQHKTVLPVRYPSKNSDESGNSSRSNALEWFNESNKRPVFDERESEPPFFQKQDSSSSNSSGLAGIDRRLQNLQNPYRLQSTLNNGSGSDDYRSVIDDLTIENRKLKERLRKYEASHNSKLEKDKLFEVKVHGLPARKKRELEETLRAFASSIDSFTGSSSKRSRNKLSASASGSKNPASSSTSNSRPINSDSAYASMSQSGAVSRENTKSNRLEGSSSEQRQASNDKNVESFLHTMAPGLLPKHPSVMTERQRKKEVVRRLEQLFTGKKAGMIGDHSQPLQQQEVSRSAARADQAVQNDPRADEGIREAQILKGQHESGHPSLTAQDSNKTTNLLRQQSSSSLSPDDDPPSPEQRPTRPLDLDPDRQQVPADNLEYIRHLGLSTPHLTAEATSDLDSDSDRWIYLNLLIGMAQLHIINVTPDFVRSAVAEVSEKFQLSRDGRKIRWKGGSEGTRFSSGSSESEDGPADSSPDGESLKEQTRKKRKTSMSSTHKQNSGSYERSCLATGSRRSGVLHYKPLGLFRHQTSSEEDLTSLESEWQASGLGRTPGPQVMKGKSLSSGSSRKRRRDDGPIVFYSGANFCVDLSGDRGNITTPQHHVVNHTQTPIGYKSQRPDLSRTGSGSFLARPPFKDYSIGSDYFHSAAARPKTPEPLKSEDGIDFDFSPNWASDKSNSPTTQLQELAASGLGGTQPADHFAIRVKTRRPRLSSQTRVKIATGSAAHLSSHSLHHAIRPSALELFRNSLGGSIEDVITSRNCNPYSSSLYSPGDLPVQTEVLSTSSMDHLSPSHLPEPIFLMASGSSDDGSEAESSSSSIGIDHLRRNGTFSSPSPSSESDNPIEEHTYRDVTMGGQEDDDDEDEDDDVDSEGSIDMLAHAREADPATIAAREEEFENQAQRRRLDEVPAGSSAATIDGGSGFSSEVSTVGSGTDRSY